MVLLTRCVHGLLKQILVSVDDFASCARLLIRDRKSTHDARLTYGIDTAPSLQMLHSIVSLHLWDFLSKEVALRALTRLMSSSSTGVLLRNDRVTLIKWNGIHFGVIGLYVERIFSARVTNLKLVFCPSIRCLEV